jgi:hypothetical protein
MLSAPFLILQRKLRVWTHVFHPALILGTYNSVWVLSVPIWKINECSEAWIAKLDLS